MTYSAPIRLMCTLGIGLALAACDDGGGAEPPPPSGTGGSGGAPAAAGELVQWTTTGYIDAAMNPFGIKGSWFSYNDCMDAQAQVPPLPCTVPDADPTLIGPDMKPGWRVVSETEVCAKGVAPKVDKLADGTTDAYSFQWGAGISFELNNVGGDMPQQLPFNATAAGINTGFTFDIKGSAPMEIRINMPITATSTATNKDAHFWPVAVPAAPGMTVNAPFLNIKQGAWAAMATPSHEVAFDPTNIIQVQFQVFTKTASTTPYDFCVSNFRVLR